MRSLYRCQFVIIAASILFLTGCGSPADPQQPRFSANLQATQHPLVAQYQVTVSTAAQVTVEFGPTTAYGRSTATQSVSTSSQTSILVAGMRPASTYHMRARIDFASGPTLYDSDHVFTTKALPNVTFPQVTVNQTSGFSAQGVDVTSSTGPKATAAVFDHDGSLIWYYYDPAMPPLTFPLKFLPNGHFITQYYQNLREVDLSGKIVREETIAKLDSDLKAAGYSIQPVEFHHDMLSLDNGHWILLVDLQKDYQDLPGYPGTTHVVGDAIIDLDANNRVVWVWNTFDHLDVNRHPYNFPDWTHSNALVYTADGDLLLSMRHQSWIIKINYAKSAGNGDILWRLGPEGDFNLAQDDVAQWFYNQHAPIILQSAGSKTTLGVFDNGNTRPDASGQPCEPNNDCYSRGLVMDFDEDVMTASVSWQYQPGWYSMWGGNIERLPNGDTEIDFTSPAGGPSRVLETDSSAMPKLMWQMNSTSAEFYRAYRIPSLYPGVQW